MVYIANAQSTAIDIEQLYIYIDATSINVNMK